MEPNPTPTQQVMVELALHPPIWPNRSYFFHQNCATKPHKWSQRRPHMEPNPTPTQQISVEVALQPPIWPNIGHFGFHKWPQHIPKMEPDFFSQNEHLEIKTWHTFMRRKSSISGTVVSSQPCEGLPSKFFPPPRNWDRGPLSKEILLRASMTKMSPWFGAIFVQC